MKEICDICGDLLPHKYKGCVATVTKIPTEAETVPENLDIQQTMSMIKVMLKDTLDMVESITEEEGMIRIGVQFKMWKHEDEFWQCHYLSPHGDEWSPCYPMGANSPLVYFPRIIQCMSRKKLDIWLMTRYYCMA